MRNHSFRATSFIYIQILFAGLAIATGVKTLNKSCLIEETARLVSSMIVSCVDSDEESKYTIFFSTWGSLSSSIFCSWEFPGQS